MSDSSDASFGVVVAAAGQSQRMGVDKLFLPLAGRPVLAWALDALEQTTSVTTTVVVAGQINVRRIRGLVARRGYQKIRLVCPGGPRRQDSVRIGMKALDDCTWVGVVDGARPFLTSDLLNRGLAVAQSVGGAVAALPVKDTIKDVGKDAIIDRTPPRAGLWAAQTPQIFRYHLLAQAYSLVGDQDVTDDAELVERFGQPVAVYPGDEKNLKITTKIDYVLARVIARTARSQ